MLDFLAFRKCESRFFFLRFPFIFVFLSALKLKNCTRTRIARRGLRLRLFGHELRRFGSPPSKPVAKFNFLEKCESRSKNVIARSSTERGGDTGYA